MLKIVRDWLKAFQAGPFTCRENACALTHIEEALLWMAKRADDRVERGVLGSMKNKVWYFVWYMKTKNLSKPCGSKRFLVRREGFEPPAFWSVARRSIQLS